MLSHDIRIEVIQFQDVSAIARSEICKPKAQEREKATDDPSLSRSMSEWGAAEDCLEGSARKTIQHRVHDKATNYPPNAYMRDQKCT